MGLTTFEKLILAELKSVTGNRKLKGSDLLEWSTGQVNLQKGEKSVFLPHNGVTVVIPDKEGAA